MTYSPQDDLVFRVRRVLTGAGALREVNMFGGRAFMVDEAMVVSAGKDGSLFVRVPAAKHDQLLREPGAAQAEMGAGRTMGAGWIAVAAATVQNDDVLSSWIEVALAHRRTG